MCTSMYPLALATTVLASTALAREPPVPCEVTTKLSYRVYVPVAVANLGGWSEAAKDNAAGHYAACHERSLSASLTESPNTKVRIARLRTLLRQLCSQESGIAAKLAGGGTMYGHAIPRSYMDIELFLNCLAVLAGNGYGSSAAVRGESQLNEIDAVLGERFRKLRAQPPTDPLKLLG